MPSPARSPLSSWKDDVPGWLSRFLLRARATISPRHDRELRDELQLHLRLLEDEYRAQGVPPDVARRRAHLEFGNATLFQETSHDLFSFRLLGELAHDVRYAMREMRRSVGFTCIAVTSLAVGIGAVTAAFAVIDAFMLRGLPVREPERLVAFSTGPDWGGWPYAAFLRWRRSAVARVEVGASWDVCVHEVPLRGADKPAEVRVSLVSSNYFQVIGADIALGRDLADTEKARPGSAAVAVISHAFWERWFGGTPDVLAKTLNLHGVPYEVVGVTRKGFTGHFVGHPSDVWIPLSMQPALMPDAPVLLEDRWGTGPGWLRIVGRVVAGVSLADATTSANLIRQQFLAEKAAELGASNPRVVRERKQVISLLSATTGYAPERGDYARPLLFVWGITALVLLVACANFTNLMLARSEGRRREFVIRLALGAGRWRLLRQSATECILLAVVAGLLGLLFASWATTVSLKQFAAMIMPVEFALELDARVLTFAAGCVALVIAFGLWPCTRPARSAAESSIHQSSSGRNRARTRTVASRTMLVVQLTMCTILLIGAGLLLRTVTNLRSQDLGFDRNVLLVSISPQQAGYSGQAAEMLVQRIRERLSAVPGIQAVGISGPTPLDFTNYWVDGSQVLTTDRGVVLPGASWTSATVGPGFFETVGMSLISGRGFDDRDLHPPADVVVVNQSLATVLFGRENPIGRRIRMNPRDPMQSVIGVVNDAKQVSPRDRGLGVAYLPMRGFGHVVLAVRTSGPPADAAPVLRHQLGSIAGDLPIEKVRTIAEILDEAIARERLMSGISLFLGALVIMIGCVGLYALMSYDVAQRTHELGVRLALGATSKTIVTMVLRDSASLVLPALVIGLPLGIAASQPLSSQLYGVESNDAWTLASVAVLLAGVALVATLRPAQIASRIDPIDLLRSE
jgi:predicted permease